MPGSVVTFYSYKGGVGRSFALANVAVILAQWGYRVLTVDWDIEAPGLHHYFSPHIGELAAGVMDFLADCKKGAPRAWSSYAYEVQIPDCRGKIMLMPAGATKGVDYTGLVQALDWEKLYSEHQFGEKLEALRSAWIEEFDLVLVDSRTGVTDFSGVTTAQLPDVLAFMFTANRQSLDGCSDVARRAMRARRNLPVDRPALFPLPIVAKFEQREEYDRAQEWRGEFARTLGGFFELWAPASVEPARLIDLLTLPYVPRWTFGEDLAAALEPRDPEGVRTPSSPMSYPLETLAAVLANSLKKIDLLASSRDEYVLTARAGARVRKPLEGRPLNVFLSYVRKDVEVARDVEKIMEQRGLKTLGIYDMRMTENVVDNITRMLDEADALVALVSPAWLSSDYSQYEFEYFVRQTLRSDSRKPIIPLILPGSTQALRDSRLSDFAGVTIDPSRPLDKQLDPVLRRLSGASPVNRNLYLLYQQQDEALANEIAMVLRGLDVDVTIPLFEGTPQDVQDDLKESLLHCDGVILVWGEASEVWVRATIRAMSGLRAKRQKTWDTCALILGRPFVTAKSRYRESDTVPILDEILDWTSLAHAEDGRTSLERLIRS